MRRLFSALLLAGAVLTAIACGEQSTAPVTPPAVSLVPAGCNPVQAGILVHGLFAKYPVKEPTAKALLSSFLLSLKTGKPLTVQKAFLAFMKFVLASRDENLLSDPDGTGPLDANTGSDLLLRNLAACAGITLPNNFSDAVASGGDAKVIGPEGGRLKTQAQKAGLLVRPKPGSTGEFLYAVAPFQRPPAGGAGGFAAASVEGGSCLGTTLREVGECFSYEVFPFRTFEDGDLLLAICDPPVESNPEHDFVRLARKRNGPGETGADIYPKIVNSSNDEMGGLHLEGCNAESPPPDIAAAFRPFLGENRANAVARFVGHLTRVFSPKPLYAGDALSASPRLLSIWTGVLPKRQFSGAVTNDNEEPSAIAGATVTFSRDETEVGSTVTSADGRFLSPFLETGNAVHGTYDVTIAASSYQMKTLSGQLLPFGRGIITFPPPAVRPAPDQDPLVQLLGEIRLLAPARAASTTTLIVQSNFAVANQPFSLNATVTANGIPVPGLSVEFFDGETFWVTASTDANGIAAISTSSISRAVHKYSARFGGTTALLPSTSNVAMVHTVERFTSLAAFNDALGGVTTQTQDFESFDFGTPISTIVTGVLNVSSPFETLEVFASSCGKMLFGYDNTTRAAGNGRYDLNFVADRNALAFEVECQNPATDPARVEVHSTFGTLTFLVRNETGNESSPTFLGMIATLPIQQVIVREGPEIGGGGNEEIGLDDFIMANVSAIVP